MKLRDKIERRGRARNRGQSTEYQVVDQHKELKSIVRSIDLYAAMPEAEGREGRTTRGGITGNSIFRCCNVKLLKRFEQIVISTGPCYRRDSSGATSVFHGDFVAHYYNNKKQ